MADMASLTLSVVVFMINRTSESSHMLPSQRYMDLISVIFTQAASLFSTRSRAIAGPSSLEEVVRIILARDVESGTKLSRPPGVIPGILLPGTSHILLAIRARDIMILL